tara:strand:+ start:40 stop:309 length:270 start_codon:yes stop_codon:yes gene_type:complete
MRTFILKTVVITLAIYILFQFTLGQVIRDISSKFKLVSNHHQRIEIKTKILEEMKKGTEKENLFSDEERIILSNFINKILSELKIAPRK